MRKTILLLALLPILSCSTDEQLLQSEDLETYTIETSHKIAVRSGTTIQKKNDFPEPPELVVPTDYLYNFTGAGEGITFKKGLGRNEFRIQGYLNMLTVSNDLNGTDFSEVMVLSASTELRNGAFDLVLYPTHVFVGVNKENVLDVPTIEGNGLIDFGDWWGLYVLPNENGHYIQIGEYENLHQIGRPGEMILFRKQNGVSGDVTISDGIYEEITEVELP